MAARASGTTRATAFAFAIVVTSMDAGLQVDADAATALPQREFVLAVLRGLLALCLAFAVDVVAHQSSIHSTSASVGVTAAGSVVSLVGPAGGVD